jgi:signal-transduction protein with cAMP-binding, CBS, and nucleotidyltransferase domain
MVRDKVVTPLLRVPAFAGLKPLQITEIARQVKKLKFLRGDIITKAGQMGDGAYLIVSGPTERVSGHGVGAKCEPVEPGSLIGEMAMLIEHAYGSTVVARDWVFCLKIMRAAMHAQMLEDASLAAHLQHHVTQRLLQVAEDLRQIDGMLAAREAKHGEAQELTHTGAG